MPAPTFFSMLKSVRELKREENAVLLRELCDIVVIAWGSSDYYKSMRENYTELLLTPEQLAARKNPRVFDVNNPERAKEAANLLASFLGQNKKRGGVNV